MTRGSNSKSIARYQLINQIIYLGMGVTKVPYTAKDLGPTGYKTHLVMVLFDEKQEPFGDNMLLLALYLEILS